MSLMRARVNAAIYDGIVLLIPVGLLTWLTLQLVGNRRDYLYSTTMTGNPHGVATDVYFNWTALLVVEAIAFGYFFVCEACWGQTLGKHRYGVCVRSANGRTPGLVAIAVRNFIRLIEATFFYIPAVCIALLSGRRRRRLGDLLAGTVVVTCTQPDDPPERPLFGVVGVPVAAVTLAIVVGLATGSNPDWALRQQAMALVRSYVAARQSGDGPAACALLTTAEQRDVVAIQSGDYATATAVACPSYILQSVPDSHLLTPWLLPFSQATMLTNVGPGGSVVVSSTGDPGLALVAVPDNGKLRLDVFGIARIQFVQACAATHRLSGASCGCLFDLLRAQDELPFDGVSTQSYLSAVQEDGPRCGANSEQGVAS